MSPRASTALTLGNRLLSRTRSEVYFCRHAVAVPAPPLKDVDWGSQAISPAAATVGSVASTPPRDCAVAAIAPDRKALLTPLPALPWEGQLVATSTTKALRNSRAATRDLDGLIQPSL